MPKKPTGSTGKSGASLLTKESRGKSMGLGSTSKSTFGSGSNKSNTFGSSASKASSFGSSASKSSNFDSTPKKNSVLGSSPNKTSIFGAHSQKETYARGPSFLVGGSKISSGHTPSTSRKTYDTASFNQQNSKSSTGFGIIWLPGRKRNKKKDMAYSAINNDKKNERTPTMYKNIMSGDSPDYQLNKKKEEDVNLLVPEKVKGPIATAASAGVVTIISEAPSETPISALEEKLLNHDKEESKEAGGDANDDKENDDSDYLENKDVTNKSPESKHKSLDKVDSVIINPGIKPPPPDSAASTPDEEECIIKCLYYTLQCCDCVLM